MAKIVECPLLNSKTVGSDFGQVRNYYGLPEGRYLLPAPFQFVIFSTWHPQAIGHRPVVVIMADIRLATHTNVTT